jgi:hypothetical protein
VTRDDPWWHLGRYFFRWDSWRTGFSYCTYHRVCIFWE